MWGQGRERGSSLLLHESMGSCCTKSSAAQEEQNEHKFAHQNYDQNGAQKHQEQLQHVAHNHKHTPQHHHHHWHAREQERSVVEDLQQPAQAAKKPPAAAVAAVPQSDRRKTARRIVGSNIRDNTSVPLGKKTNFGYQRDFKAKYTLGKLLGHGQFGYTYVAIQKATGMRVAVKTIEKKQVLLQTHISLPC